MVGLRVGFGLGSGAATGFVPAEDRSLASFCDTTLRLAKGMGTIRPFQFRVTVVASALMKMACKVLPWVSVQECIPADEGAAFLAWASFSAKA